MKMRFFKERVLATLVMLTLLFACAAIDSTIRTKGTSQVEKQEEVIVILYSTEWCHWCKTAKAFMRDNNIKFIEKDPNKTKDFKELTDLAIKTGVDLEKLNAVPLFIIKSRIIIGFNPKEILCMVSNKDCKTNFTRSMQSF